MHAQFHHRLFEQPTLLNGFATREYCWRWVARGVLDASRRNQILATVREVVEDLADHDDRRPMLDATAAHPETEAAIEQTDESEGASDLPVLAAAELREKFAGRGRVVCIGARSQLDEAAALMLSQILEKHGLAAEALPPNTLLTSGMMQLAERDPALVCLCYIGPQNAAHMKYALRRLRRHTPMAILVLGQLSQVSDPKADVKGPSPADVMETSLRGICRVCLTFAAKGAPA